ncbi:hypothetical protein AAVH_30526 [Aphelenchoides avenae]|nr:hypothetical protein AAVH_30526 [Aphelenchus avenae]
MAAFIEYCKHLSFEEEPDYDFLKKCLRRATTRNLASYPSLTIDSLECYPCRRKKAMADARPERLNDSIVSGADAQMAVAMRRSNVFPTAISRPQLSCRTDIDLADCAKFESNSVKDLAAYATEQAQKFGWKSSQDSVFDHRKCRKCEERLKSFYDSEKQRTGELSWQVRRRIDEDARTMYGHRFW